MNIILYLRVSTDRQAEDGYGLDVQEADSRAYAKANHHKITAIYIDSGISGSNGLADREALPEALNALRTGKADGLLVPKLDRLSRDVILQETIMRDIWVMGREILSTLPTEQNLRNDPDDPSRKLIRVILGAIAEYERELIALRLRKARKLKASRGGYAGYGAPPLGFTAVGKELVREDREQATIGRVRELRTEGKTIRQIIAVLEAEGHQTKRGARWHPATVARILRSDDQHQADIARGRKTKERATSAKAARRHAG